MLLSLLIKLHLNVIITECNLIIFIDTRGKSYERTANQNADCKKNYPEK